MWFLGKTWKGYLPHHEQVVSGCEPQRVGWWSMVARRLQTCSARCAFSWQQRYAGELLTSCYYNCVKYFCWALLSKSGADLTMLVACCVVSSYHRSLPLCMVKSKLCSLVGGCTNGIPRLCTVNILRKK